MDFFKKIWDKLKAPKVLFSILYSFVTMIICIMALVAVLTGGSEMWYSYIIYCIAAILLTYLVYIIVYFAPMIKQAIITSMKKHRFFAELLESYGYRSVVFASISFIINIAYATFHAVIAIMSKSIWLGALAVYYITITSIRGGIISITRKRKNKKKEFSLEKQIKSYRNCGIYIVILNFAFMSAIVQMAIGGAGFEYAGIMIFVMAAYTFWKLGMAIYNIFKARKLNDPTIQSLRNLSLVDSLVSILALQTAMLFEFSNGINQSLPNSLTGAAVSLATIAIGVIMIVRGQINLNRIKKEKNNEQEVWI